MKLGRHEHYFVKKPLSKKKEYSFTANVFGVPLNFVTAAGIFSPRKIDLGTLVLVRYMRLASNQKVLDFGCGYGAVGVMVAKTCPTCRVTMVDINERAVESSKKNIRLNNVSNASAKQSFFYSGLKDETFDTILSNPPVSAGLEDCYRIIEGARDHLIPGGTLQIVSRHQKGGKRLMDKMREVFGNVEVLAKKSGYWIYSSTNL
jgi:16S rRNA (guanine1207-N2)-methyltransferase